ncbi:MAG: phytanoyl-CoA dioxygenase [Alphaproteobacteria bacterium]|nr:phytanoyl-CoA dioxygenase [Alphaproteobacteria bacterium]
MSVSISSVVSEELISEFETRGAVCLRGVFDSKWVDLVAQGVECELANPGPLAKDYSADDAPGRFFGDLVMWQRVPQFRAFAFDSPAAEIAGRVMRSAKVNFYHDHLLIKEPGTREKTPWHHDQPYYFVNGRQVCSIWMPLDPVDRDTCVRFVSGSHNWGRWFAPRYFVDGEDYYADEEEGIESMPDFDSARDTHDFLFWDLEPGDCIVFHALTIHGAPGNAATHRRRRAYATRWMGDDARFAERPGLVSPQIEGHGLKPGDAMDCAHFPVIWRARPESNL